MYSLVFDMVMRFLIPLLVTMWTNVAIYRILKITDSCSDSKEGQVIWIFDLEISPSRNETKVIKRLEYPGLLGLSFNDKIDPPVKMIYWKC